MFTLENDTWLNNIKELFALASKCEMNHLNAIILTKSLNVACNIKQLFPLTSEIEW